jgi:Dyp-type peroxidase family
MSPIEIDDVQSLLLTPYPEREGAVFVTMNVQPGAASTALGSLAALLEQISFGKPREGDASPCAQIAFSARGLCDLGLDPELVAAFPPAFLEGMPKRTKILSDHAENHSSRWHWGGRSGTPGALLLVYAQDAAGARSHAAQLCRGSGGWLPKALPETVRLRVPGDPPSLSREHFGFADGIANPHIAGLDAADRRPENRIAAGEFVLGYPNESGEYPDSPRIVPGGGRGVALPGGDFGRNGSFLVARQLEQDVVGFWKMLLDLEHGDEERAIFAASKMVGRWRNGAPLTRWREFEPPAGDRQHDDDFLYAQDPDGFGCPIGAHVRRANPRDAVPKLDPQSSLASSRKRRLLRRGRPYGDAVPGWPDPKKIVEGAVGARGLHFLCLCASLVDQFEFVQETWLNGRHFAGLVNDADPLLSQHVDPLGGGGKTGFTIQRRPLNRRIRQLPRFVTVRGGGYFFLPGRNALRYVARLS